MDTLSTPLPVIERPKFARWLWDRDISNAAAGELLGVGREAIRRWCLPFSDPGRVEPRLAEKTRIFDLTGGEVGAADWYPASLSQRAAERVAEDVQ